MAVLGAQALPHLSLQRMHGSYACICTSSEMNHSENLCLAYSLVALMFCLLLCGSPPLPPFFFFFLREKDYRLF